MEACEAEVTEIPTLTKTEEVDWDKHAVQDIFSGDDITGLDLSFKRQRGIQVHDIEEYLQTLEYKPSEDGDQCEYPGDPAKDMFKRNYKMKISVEPEELSNSRDSAKTNLKNNQISTMSTKSNLKRLEGTGMKLFTLSHEIKKDNFLLFCINTERRIIPIAMKNESSLLFNEKDCHCKIFTTKNRITKVDIDECMKSWPNSDLDLPSKFQELNFDRQQENFHSELDMSFDYFKLYFKLKEELIASYSLPNIHAETKSGQICSIFIGEQELILLEFSTDEELEGQRDLMAIHCYSGPSTAASGVCSSLHSRVENITKQDGFCSMKKFVAKLLDHSLQSDSPTIKYTEYKDFDVKSLLLQEMPHVSLESNAQESRRRQSNSARRKNSVVELMNDDFFEEGDDYFQLMNREKTNPSQGSFSL